MRAEKLNTSQMTNMKFAITASLLLLLSSSSIVFADQTRGLKADATKRKDNNQWFLHLHSECDKKKGKGFVECVRCWIECELRDDFEVGNGSNAKGGCFRRCKKGRPISGHSNSSNNNKPQKELKELDTGCATAEEQKDDDTSSSAPFDELIKRYRNYKESDEKKPSRKPRCEAGLTCVPLEDGDVDDFFARESTICVNIEIEDGQCGGTRDGWNNENDVIEKNRGKWCKRSEAQSRSEVDEYGICNHW